MKHVAIFLISTFLIVACTPKPQTSQPEVIKVYSTSAAQPWMNKLYTCAADSSVVLKLDADSPDIYLRLGEPLVIITPVFQIDEEEILIVTSRESPTQNLTLEAAQALFAQENPSVQVWIYSSGEDVQGWFDQHVMNGRSVTSYAQVAVSEQNMSDVLNAGTNAVGILTSHWKAGNVRIVFSAGKVPVLAIAKEEPKGAIKDVLSCLQSH